MTQISLYYNSTSRLSCDCVLPAQVILCVPEAIIAPREATPNFDYRTIEASITARSVINDCCGSTFNRYTISYDDTQLVDQIPLRADQIQGIVCRGCLTTWVEDVAGDDVTVVDNGDDTQTLVNQHGNQFPLVVTGMNLLNCEYVASQYGGTNQAALAAAIAAIAGADATLFIDCGTWAINANQIIPSNIHVKVLKGALLSVANGITLQIQGQFDAPSSPVFNLNTSGLVLFQGNGIVDANAAWFGDTLLAIQQAVNSSRSVVVPKRTYTSAGAQEIQITQPSQKLVFHDVTLLAGANAVALIRWSASDGVLEGNVTLDGNGFTQVTGLRVAPLNEGGVALVTTIDRNSFSNILISNCDEGVVLAEGPTVLGVTSTTENNIFVGINCVSTVRAVWFKDGPNLGSAGCNKNTFTGINVSGDGNTGIHIVNGSQNTFTGCVVSDRIAGISPLATPTAVRIEATNAFAVATAFNCFTNITTDNTTLHVYNESLTTSLIGCRFSNFSFPALPRFTLAGSPSSVPVNLADALIYQDAALVAANISGFNVNRNVALQNNVEIFDYNVPWQAYNPPIGSFTNVSAIGDIRCAYKKFNGEAIVVLQAHFTPINAFLPVDLILPLSANAALYINGADSMKFPCVVDGGAANETRHCFLAAINTIRFYGPTAGWGAGALACGVYADLRYRT